MSCARFRSRIRDKALGAESDPTVDAHLASCETCQAALRADTAVASTLDGDIEALVTTDLPVGLQARARVRLAARLAERPVRGRRLLSASFRVPVLGALAFLVAWTALVVLVTRPNRGAPSVRESTVPTPTPMETRPFRAAAARYRSLEGFRPLRSMTIEIEGREGSR